LRNEEIHADIRRIKELEQIGVLRVVLFLGTQRKLAGDFKKVIAWNTFEKARRVLMDFGLLETEAGDNRRLLHFLTEKGIRFAEALRELLIEE
jgi:hypothetical protein